MVRDRSSGLFVTRYFKVPRFSSADSSGQRNRQGWQEARGCKRLLVQRPIRTEMPTYSRLTREQRFTVEAMNRNGSEQKEIAEVIGKHPSTVSPASFFTNSAPPTIHSMSKPRSASSERSRAADTALATGSPDGGPTGSSGPTSISWFASPFIRLTPAPGFLRTAGRMARTQGPCRSAADCGGGAD